MSKKYLYYFSEGNDAFGGDKVTMKNTLGGKGAGLAEMTAAGMPVPQGFTITTDACTQYYADGRQINDEITADIFEHLKGLEQITGKTFGDNTNPLLVSVRSGARQSMPAMMDRTAKIERVTIESTASTAMMSPHSSIKIPKTISVSAAGRVSSQPLPAPVPTRPPLAAAESVRLC